MGPEYPLGSIGWTERTGGVLTARECVTLARPLLRGELGTEARQVPRGRAWYLHRFAVTDLSIRMAPFG